jgi:hypothetical protein
MTKIERCIESIRNHLTKFPAVYRISVEQGRGQRNVVWREKLCAALTRPVYTINIRVNMAKHRVKTLALQKIQIKIDQIKKPVHKTGKNWLILVGLSRIRIGFCDARP